LLTIPLVCRHQWLHHFVTTRHRPATATPRP
jgi:hypothetical protein